jgi:hypothetical protein
MTPKLIRDLNTWLAKLFPVEYNKYIRSDAWRAKAQAAKERALWQCQVCGRPQGVIHLDAHHRTYTRLGWEIPEDLTALCEESCHPAATRIKRGMRHSPD